MQINTIYRVEGYRCQGGDYMAIEHKFAFDTEHEARAFLSKVEPLDCLVDWFIEEEPLYTHHEDVMALLEALRV